MSHFPLAHPSIRKEMKMKMKNNNQKLKKRKGKEI